MKQLLEPHRTIAVTVLLALLIGGLFLNRSSAEDAEPPPHDIANLSLRNEVRLAIDRGLSWLESQQKPEGCWSSLDHPAITALVLTAFARHPMGNDRGEAIRPFLKKGCEFLMRNAQPDGGIYVPDKG